MALTRRIPSPPVVDQKPSPLQHPEVKVDLTKFVSPQGQARVQGTIRDALRVALAGMTDIYFLELTDAERIYGVESHEITNRMAICAALMRKAMQGNVSAFVALRDTIGEKPVDNVGFVNADGTSMAPPSVNIRFLQEGEGPRKNPGVIDTGAAIENTPDASGVQFGGAVARRAD